MRKKVSKARASAQLKESERTRLENAWDSIYYWAHQFSIQQKMLNESQEENHRLRGRIDTLVQARIKNGSR